MFENPYFKEMQERLTTVKENIHFYIDEQGVAGVDELYILGGFIAYGDISTLERDWRHFLSSNQLEGKKGRKFSKQELLKVNEFFLGKTIFPVITYFRLQKEELEDLRIFARLYEKSKYPQKKFSKISAASWLRKVHSTELLGTGIASFKACIGGIDRASVYFDRISDTPGMNEHFQTLLYENTASAQFEEGAILTAELANILEEAKPNSWNITLEGKGRLLELADVICTMFGHYLHDRDRGFWDILILQHKINGRITPPSMGRDITDAVRAWLSKLYEQREVLESHI